MLMIAVDVVLGQADRAPTKAHKVIGQAITLALEAGTMVLTSLGSISRSR